MKKISVVLFPGFLILLLASYSVYAEPCGLPENAGRINAMEHGGPMLPLMMHHGMDMKDGMPGMGPFMGKRLMELGLDEKQKEAIKNISSRVLKNTIRKRAEVEIARTELRDILDKDIVDLNEVETTLKKIEALNIDMHFLHIKTMEEIKTKLTPDQKKKLKAPFDRMETAKKKPQSSEK